MSRQAKRNLSWYCLMVGAIAFFALCGYEMREHKFMMADEESLSL